MSTIRQAIETRIRDQVPGLRQVAGSADLTAVLTGRTTPPAAYVFEMADNAVGSANGGSQQVVESFAVIVVVTNHRDTKGTDSADTCRDIRHQIFQALTDFQPDGSHDPIVYASGSLVSFENGFLYWQDVYKTTGVWPG